MLFGSDDEDEEEVELRPPAGDGGTTTAAAETDEDDEEVLLPGMEGAAATGTDAGVSRDASRNEGSVEDRLERLVEQNDRIIALLEELAGEETDAW